jgi:hypothetical protein
MKRDTPLSAANQTAAAPRRRGGSVPPGSKEALRTGAAVLEVLAGLRSVADAAAALGCSVPRYYQVEQQALRALVAGCEPRPLGRQPSADTELVRLQKENARLVQEVQRQQALVRLARQAAGLASPSPSPAAGQKRRPRQAARGQQAARRLLAAAAADESASPVEVPVPEASG